MHRHTIRHGFLAVLIGALLVGAGSAARAGWPGQHADRHPHYRFGVVEAYYRPGDALDLGVGWERIIFEWAAFQPNGPDEYRTEAVPVEWLADAQRAGREVIGLLKNTPLWASDIHKLGAPPNGLHLPIDDPGNYWAAFVRRTVEEYGREWGINHWIIYNEPDIRPGDLGWYEFDGDVEDYYNMVKVAYRAAKSANPRAKIHLAGMAWYVDLQAARDLYLERLLRVAENDPEAAANGYFFDVVMVHTYFDTLNVWQMIRDIRRLLHRHGLYDKPLWVDETNARPSRDDLADVPPGMFEISLSQQADYIVQAAALSLAAGVERFGVYRLYDDNYTPGFTEPWGLVRSDGSRRPAFAAYQNAIALFAGANLVQYKYSDHSSLVVLQKDAATIYVMWARRTPQVRFHVMARAADETATTVSVTGATRTVAPERVSYVENWWYVLDAPGAVADPSGRVIVEGSPVIVVAEGPPRPVWIEVNGRQWRFG